MCTFAMEFESSSHSKVVISFSVINYVVRRVIHA